MYYHLKTECKTISEKPSEPTLIFSKTFLKHMLLLASLFYALIFLKFGECLDHSFQNFCRYLTYTMIATGIIQFVVPQISSKSELI
jgi:uncharacterized membrane protein